MAVVVASSGTVMVDRCSSRFAGARPCRGPSPASRADNSLAAADAPASSTPRRAFAVAAVAEVVPRGRNDTTRARTTARSHTKTMAAEGDILGSIPVGIVVARPLPLPLLEEKKKELWRLLHCHPCAHHHLLRCC